MNKEWSAGIVAGCSLLFAGIASATPVVVDGAFYFREFRSANDVGNSFGERLIYGANSALPNGDAGTTATRAFGANSPVEIPFNPRTTNPDQFSGSTGYTLGRASQAANLAFTNGTDTTLVSVPAVGDIGRMPFARGLSLSGTGTALSFAWSNPVAPAGVSLERTQIRIFDLENFNSAGNADVIHSAFLASPTITSYSLPSVLSSSLSLTLGHRYAVAIRLEDLRSGVDPALGAARLSSSQAYFNFTPTASSLPPNVYLPIHESGSRFVFDIPVVPGVEFKVDPPVAVGYDYAIGPGNPNFQAVTLPTAIGDNSFQLLLWDGTGFDIDAGTLTGGVEHTFGAGGVDRFRVLGIETSAGLDPADTLAFVTGLKFTAAGDFTGTMTPIVAVPEPETYLLMLAGLVLVGCSASRRKRA